MKILDLTFNSPEENLACDEVLLDELEAGRGNETLRFWEPSQYFVVLGFSNAWKKEVRLGNKSVFPYPILRRTSGGGTVLQGPGCLNYSLLINVAAHADFAGVVGTNRHIMNRHRIAMEELLGAPVAVQGSTDLTTGHLKFSGNSQRRKKKALLFHGTFLYNFDLGKIETCLPIPSKQPAYRNERTHLKFLTNLTVPSRAVKETLIRAWDAKPGSPRIPKDAITRMAREKYQNPEWNLLR